ncbi:MAG: 1-deoxy-D-xylulose-5-phosphate reductoisomerase [Oscillospiraceae bacterium]
MKNVSILGSTGSIGKQAINVCMANDFHVVALAAKQSVSLLAAQAKLLKPEIVCIYDETKYTELKSLIGDSDIKIVTGMEGLCEAASINNADITLNSVVGMIGLKPTLEAIKAKKDIALANKETLVTGGKLVISSAKENNVKILPVDSEHSAIFQAMQGNAMNNVKKIILTASGGPFFGKSKLDLQNVTVKQALNHPNWDMGAKITIDSATLMNKGLELIEAVWLFDKKASDIEIVVHRQSVVHSAVEYEDNSVIAQLGVPDMKIPIQYALTYPNRVCCDVKRLSLTDYGALTFEKADTETFICLQACIKAISLGGLYPTIVNGANEQAVELFLKEKISFWEIGQLVLRSIESVKSKENFDFDDIIDADKVAREFVLSNV